MDECPICGITCPARTVDASSVTNPVTMYVCDECLVRWNDKGLIEPSCDSAMSQCGSHR